MALPKEVAEAVLGTALQPLLQQRMAERNSSKKGQIAKPLIEYHDLEMHRIVGTGQFGMVYCTCSPPINATTWPISPFHTTKYVGCFFSFMQLPASDVNAEEAACTPCASLHLGGTCHCYAMNPDGSTADRRRPQR